VRKKILADSVDQTASGFPSAGRAADHGSIAADVTPIDVEVGQRSSSENTDSPGTAAELAIARAAGVEAVYVAISPADDAPAAAAAADPAARPLAAEFATASGSPHPSAVACEHSPVVRVPAPGDVHDAAAVLHVGAGTAAGGHVSAGVDRSQVEGWGFPA
jgi:hypothetical protein